MAVADQGNLNKDKIKKMTNHKNDNVWSNGGGEDHRGKRERNKAQKSSRKRKTQKDEIKPVCKVRLIGETKDAKMQTSIK